MEEKSKTELLDEIQRLHTHVKELKTSTLRDELTGLPNRTALGDRFTVAQAYAKRTNSSVVIMMVDIDKFKNVNDTHGHAVGDELLKEVSRRLCSCLREYDTVARLSGDEFVLMPSCAADHAELLAKRVMRAFNKKFSRRMKITISVGIAMYPAHGLTLSELMKKADAAMYQAKGRGRNRYVMAQA